MKPVFGGNHFATPVGKRIDDATDASLTTENWAWNMEICDIINDTEDGPKDAARALRKKIQNNVGKNYLVIQLALTILETCVKNCGRRFHLQIANKDFLYELIKILMPKNDAPTVVQDKVLALIQSWANAFQNVPELKEFGKMYADLKAKGIEFPVTELDGSAPIHTPGRTIESAPAVSMQPFAQSQGKPLAGASDVRSRSVRASQAPQQVSSPASTGAGPSNVTQHQMNTAQLTKLQADLDVVQGNCRVFNEMLNEIGTGGSGRPVAAEEDLDLLNQLEVTCRQMQRRVVELLERVTDERITERLLHVNDELNNVFVRHERFERYRKGQATLSATSLPQSATTQPPAPAPPQPASAAPTRRQELAENLIDFCNAIPAGSGQTAVTALQPQPATSRATASASVMLDDEFDMLAISRQPLQQSVLLPAGAPAAISGMQSQDPRGAVPEWKDAEELEAWLSKTTATGPSNAAAPPNEANATTSSEFDEFLMTRAQAGENLPSFDLQSYESTTTAPGAAVAAGLSSSLPRGRQMQKDESEKAMFAL